MTKIRKLLILMMAALITASGCSKDPFDDNSQEKSKTEITNQTDTNDENKKQGEEDKLPPELPEKSKDNKEQEKEMKIKVYYPDESGMRLIGVSREVETTKNGNKYEAAVKAVMTPPTEKNLTKVINNDKSLIDVKVSNGEAKVNLSESIKKGFSGGSTGEEMLVGSIVNTLTEFSEVKSVRFLIDGQKIETLSGHMDLSEPIKRMDNLMNNKS